jgi:hypothetical protein
MNQTQTARSTVERHFQLSPERVRWLSSVARTRGVGESQIVEKALDILSSLTDLFEEGAEHQGWSLLSEPSLQRVWDNEADAAYDNWRELYGVPAQ